MQIDIDDDVICLVIVRRKVNPVTDKDAGLVIAPRNASDAVRINLALVKAQKMLIDLTAKTALDATRQANELK